MPDGRLIRVHELAAPRARVRADGLVMVWHHGSPQTGAPLAPVARWAGERGLRLISAGRPSYGGSTPHPGRTVASVGEDHRVVAEALGLDRAVHIGASGGGPHALAAAASDPERVAAVVTLASPAPLEGGAWAWDAGMADAGGLRAALEGGRAGRARFEETAAFEPGSFTAEDYEALEGRWSPLGDDVGRSAADGPEGIIDDDTAFARDWGVALAAVAVPVLLVQGGRDRVIPPSHAQRLLELLPSARLELRARDGHITVLDALPSALDAVLDQTG